MKSTTFSPEAITELVQRAGNRAVRHQRHARALTEEIELLERLLTGHLAGLPDTQTEMIVVGRRLQALFDMGGLE